MSESEAELFGFTWDFRRRDAAHCHQLLLPGLLGEAMTVEEMIARLQAQAQRGAIVGGQLVDAAG